MASMAITTMFIGFMANYVGLDIITYILGLGFIVFGLYYKKVLGWKI